MTSTLAQENFGANAREYVTSKPHAQGASLARMVALSNPQPDWRVLDIATGTGHAAYAFAPHVGRVWATDITSEMLAIVREQAQERGLANLRVGYAKAEALPLEDESFDLVTCRIAPHHFDRISAFLDETRRVLKHCLHCLVAHHARSKAALPVYANVAYVDTAGGGLGGASNGACRATIRNLLNQRQHSIRR